jgi:hypothetical protein
MTGIWYALANIAFLVVGAEAEFYSQLLGDLAAGGFIN